MPWSCQFNQETIKGKWWCKPAYKELLHVIKYVLDMKNLGLKIKPTGNSNTPSEIVCFSNSDYAEDPVSRRSISGFILYVLGVLVSWWSKLQKSVSLSGSQVEYVALSKAVKEVMFMIELLGSMKIIVKYPVMVRLDDVNAIFMASNIATTCHAKHVDIRYKYLNEYVEDRVLKIVFVKSADNGSHFHKKCKCRASWEGFKEGGG